MAPRCICWSPSSDMCPVPAFGQHTKYKDCGHVQCYKSSCGPHPTELSILDGLQSYPAYLVHSVELVLATTLIHRDCLYESYTATHACKLWLECALHPNTIQTSNVPYNNSKNQPMPNHEYSALGTIYSFSDASGHVSHLQFPGNFRETVWKLSLGQGSLPNTSTHCATQTALTLLRLGLSGRLVRLAACTEHNSYVSPPGTFLETSRKRPGGPGGGTPRDEDGYKRRDGQGSKGAGRLAAGWAHLARSLTAASAVPIPSGLEFESRDGSCSGTVATGRHKPDKSKTGGLCCLPEELCHQLLPVALPQGV